MLIVLSASDPSCNSSLPPSSACAMIVKYTFSTGWLTRVSLTSVVLSKSYCQWTHLYSLLTLTQRFDNAKQVKRFDGQTDRGDHFECNIYILYWQLRNDSTIPSESKGLMDRRTEESISKFVKWLMKIWYSDYLIRRGRRYKWQITGPSKPTCFNTSN